MARILLPKVAMPLMTPRLQWLISCVVFGLILLALVIAALLLDPFTAVTVP